MREIMRMKKESKKETREIMELAPHHRRYLVDHEEVLGADQTAVGYGDDGDAGGSIAFFWCPVGDVVLLRTPREVLHAFNLDDFVVEQLDFGQFVDGDTIGSGASTILAIMRPSEVGPLEIFGVGRGETSE